MFPWVNTAADGENRFYPNCEVTNNFILSPGHPSPLPIWFSLWLFGCSNAKLVSFLLSLVNQFRQCELLLVSCLFDELIAQVGMVLHSREALEKMGKLSLPACFPSSSAWALSSWLCR